MKTQNHKPNYVYKFICKDSTPTIVVTNLHISHNLFIAIKFSQRKIFSVKNIPHEAPHVYVLHKSYNHLVQFIVRAMKNFPQRIFPMKFHAYTL